MLHRHQGGHVGAYFWDGYCAPIVFQIAVELRRLLPTAIGDLPLQNMWAYKVRGENQSCYSLSLYSSSSKLTTER